MIDDVASALLGLRRLDAAARRLAVRSACWLLLFRALKHLIPLATLVRLAQGRPARRERRPADEARLAHLVVGVSRRLRRTPDGGCLERSLVLYRLLTEAGADPTLVLGVASGSGTVEGHAWVEVDGHPMGEPPDGLPRFVSVMSFPAGATQSRSGVAPGLPAE